MSFEPLIPDGDLRVQRRMIALIDRLAPHDGSTDAALEGVRFMRVSTTVPRCPVLYEPSIVIVCQGRKVGYVGERTFVYDERQYLVLSVPLPFECETYTAPHGPFLAISVRIDLGVIAELAMLLEETHGAAASEPDSICSTPLGAPLADAVLRLLETLQSPHDTRVLGPSIMREIGYRVLTGEQGDAIRAALGQRHHFGRIAKALRRIHLNLGGEHSIDALAAEAGMSAAVFHTHFRSVTGTSPMQYVKATRLHNARLMMVQEGVSAGAAAARVGYASASQFSREFKRMFGRSPGDEVRWVQANGLVVNGEPAEIN
ncbi:AraC family transcriptional regulator [Burkholderia plantarii]|uniref:AraC family transcriptional regulator n=1 Tax=Burkholderia plantarii TaxID=41899 RepID=UPI0006D8D160|nr:AraC family transcriptional regulator [Burkholderia plantarii]ALK32232.1 Transcriptional regulator, AraC family [Burkholderia plantarii]WLE57508.1 AraC family transcriptional regulator [Burkholderia plantarii]GLZ17787.1 AraC family transcriptional regulator [Burkholderia plantarii]